MKSNVLVVKPFKFLKGKKGLSPVIATVLLITLGIVLAGILFMWMRGFVSEQVEKQGKPVDQICNEISFDSQIQYDAARNIVSLQIVNRGNINIYGFDIKFIEEKDSSMKTFSFRTSIGEASEVQFIPLDGNIKQLILYPMILGSVKGKKVTKPVSCLDEGKTVNVK